MSIIEPKRRDIIHPGRIKRNSAPLRLWHWASVLIISGSLITVLINSTITDKQAINALVKQKVLETKGVDHDLSRSVAGALEDKVWAVHTYFGYVLAALLLFRFLLEFFQLADQKLIRQLKAAKGRHELTVKIIYLIFYGLLLIMVITGLGLAFDDDFSFLRSAHRQIRDIHGFCMYLILSFIALHLAGVFLAERKKESAGIISDMVNGGGSEDRYHAGK